MDLDHRPPARLDEICRRSDRAELYRLAPPEAGFPTASGIKLCARMELNHRPLTRKGQCSTTELHAHKIERPAGFEPATNRIITPAARPIELEAQK